MKVSTKFTAFEKKYVFILDTDKLDRNYDDEDYAYWVKRRDGHIFEIHIYKKYGNNTFSGVGYVIIYANMGDFEDDIECEVQNVLFTF